MKLRILIAYAMPRSGHAQAARALRQAFEKEAWCSVEEFCLESAIPKVSRAISQIHRAMAVHTPELWGYLHGNAKYHSWVEHTVRYLYRLDVGRIREHLLTNAPHIVIGTHMLLLQLCGEAKRVKEYTGALYGLTTDYWAHAYWYHPEVDKYFVSSERAKRDLLELGCAAERILTTGIPVRERFLHAPEKRVARQKLGLDPNRFTILVMGGSYGLFPMEELLEELTLFPELTSCQWLFLCGSDKERRAYIQLFLEQHPELSASRVFGFQGDMSSFMAASDLLVSKAGGLTLAEALVSSLPCLIFRPLPGQEQVNADEFTQLGILWQAESATQLCEKISYFVRYPAELEKLKKRLNYYARPQAAAQIVEDIRVNFV